MPKPKFKVVEGGLSKKTAKAKREPTKEEQLDALIQNCNKDLGDDGSVILADDVPIADRIQSGILAVDTITGGGFPRGSMSELYGEESSGKTLIALRTIAKVQADGGTVVVIFREGFDRVWARKQGVDTKKLRLINVGMGDAALEAMVALMDSGLVDLMVLDSFQSFGTSKEVEKGIEQESMGGGGANQMWGRVMRRAYATANRLGNSAPAIIGISQVRASIGKFSPHGTPDPEPIQSRAILHWKSISIQCKKAEIVYSEKEKTDKRQIISRTFRLHCKKNKTAPPERSSSFTYFFKEHEEAVKVGKDMHNVIIPEGIDYAEEAFRLGVAYELIKSSGAYYEGYGIRANGKPAYLLALRQDDDTVDKLRDDILKKV